MCGIAGWYCWGNDRPEPGMAKALLMANLTRGKSAAGVAYRDPENAKILVRKSPGPADVFVRAQPDEFWTKMATSPIALIHARATTKGSEKENVNNHPVHGYDWTVVHNGHVANDDDLWDYYKDKRTRFAEVDTSAIPLALSLGDTFEASLKHLTLLSGSVSCAMWGSKHADKVVLMRLGGNPVYMFLDPTHDILYWTSAAVAGRVMPSISMDTIRVPIASQVPEGKLIVLKPGEPFSCDVYKVDRHPFTLPHGHKSGTTKAATHGAGTSETSAAVTGHASSVLVGVRDITEYPRLRWDAGTSNFKDKPPIAINSKDVLAFKMDTWRKLVEEFKKRDVPSLRVDSGYGNWTLGRDKDGTIRRCFYPRKAVRKFFLRHFKIGKKSWPQLPVTLIGGKSEHDCKMEIEHMVHTYRASENPEVKTVWTDQAHVCPWCGAWWDRRDGGTMEFRCPMCNIQSKPYANYRG